MGCSTSVEAGWQGPDGQYHHGAKVIDNRGKPKEEKDKFERGGTGVSGIRKAANASRAGSRRCVALLTIRFVMTACACRPSNALGIDRSVGAGVKDRNAGGEGKK